MKKMSLKPGSQIKISVVLILAFLLVMSGCAESFEIASCLPEKEFGFFGGLWHGIIAPVSFVISLFSDNYVMYACNNSGGWYDFGFVIGAGILFGGGSRAAR